MRGPSHTANDRDELSSQWKTGRDEPVEVNQRALIDKILARYPCDFPAFRELLQNSDDAKASTVEIRFGTDNCTERTHPSMLPDLKSTPVIRWVFRNNGICFRDEDWTRLRKIAEGNPDEEKIGVGFYSVFSVTDCPYVSSGGHGMEFYWKDDNKQLCVRHGDLPSRGSPNQWTTIEMELKKPGPMPCAFDLVRFLTSSITFMDYLKKVTVFFDDHRIAEVKKSSGPSNPVNVPAELKQSNPSNIVTNIQFQSHSVEIVSQVVQAVYTTGLGNRSWMFPMQPPITMRTISSSLLWSFTNGPFRGSCQTKVLSAPAFQPMDPMEMHVMKLTLTLFRAKVDVKIDEKVSDEILGATKKRLQLGSNKTHFFYETGKDQYDQSITDEKDILSGCGSIFQGHRADLDGAGHTRIFIGHATGQSTGIGGHMASRFIPTVERESLDFNVESVALWNRELLQIGGFLCRVAYESELSIIHDLWGVGLNNPGTPRSPSSPELHDRFLHVLKFFTFRPSTPRGEVARLLEESFFGCTITPPRLLSSTGVHRTTDIREFHPVLCQFLKRLPVLPKSTLEGAQDAIGILRRRGMVSAIRLTDVLQELRKKVLDDEELEACLKWLCNLEQDSPPDSDDPVQTRLKILNAVSYINGNGTIVSLSSFHYFLDAKTHIPLGSPHPASVLPRKITKNFTLAQLASFNLREFTTLDWVRYVSQPDVMSTNPEYDFTKSAGWAECVLTVLSRDWLSFPSEKRDTVTTIFKGKKCIPVARDLYIPELSYLSNENTTLFDDLPIVRFPSSLIIDESMKELLVSIGVQKRVSLQLVINRMMRSGDWSVSDVIGYLLRAQDTSEEELNRLAVTPAFPAEGIQPNAGGKKPRHCVRELYEPIDTFRELRLPIIDLGGKTWQADSEEAKLLYRLGLLRHPPLQTLVKLCATSDVTVRTGAFKYLCDNILSTYRDYKRDSFEDLAFIPAENMAGSHLGAPGKVFSDPQWKALGFSVVRSSYGEGVVTRLGIQQHPSTSMLLDQLEKSPPLDELTAREWFECIFERIPSPEFIKFCKVPMVPTRESPAQWSWLSPTQCYIGKSTNDLYSKLFVYVDFGITANRFLSACGSQREPSIEDLAEMLVTDPKRFYSLGGGPEAFMAELRNLAINIRRIPRPTIEKMRVTPLLLGVGHRKVSKTRSDPLERADEELDVTLWKPEDVLIADDMSTYRQFGDSIITAPQETLLERFYAFLGSKSLSTVVRQEYLPFDPIQNLPFASQLQLSIPEKLCLFVHEHTHTRSNLDRSWLLNPNNFTVRAFRRLKMTKTLDIPHPPKRIVCEVSAAANRPRNGPIELWVSRTAPFDMYEVATSISRLLVETPNLNDALLLMTILSTDLTALKRRGYNVEKILNFEKRLDAQGVHTRGTNLPSGNMDHQRDGSALHGSTTRKCIWDNIDMAVKACRPGEKVLLQNREKIQVIQESLNESYCDVSGRVGDLRFLDEIEGTKVFVTKDTPAPNEFMAHAADQLTCFLRVLIPIADVFQLPAQSLHIFDGPDGLIACNREGSLFLNLRYFNEWHYQDVKNGNLLDAQISWFFTLAHEIAHNITNAHDSKHEFYFSSICEKFMEPLVQLLYHGKSHDARR